MDQPQPTTPNTEHPAVRTAEEVAEHYRREQGSDILGFMANVLLPYLPFELARPFLKEGATAEAWGEAQPLTREYILQEMGAYLVFGWGKVEDHRGISASRTVEKMRTWLWLLRDEETLRFAEDSGNYAQYGAPVLKRICEVYGFEMPTDERLLRMAQGLPCVPGCRSGCGEVARVWDAAHGERVIS